MNVAGGAYLFFVFNDCPEPPSRLASGTCDDRGVPNCHVETPPQDAVDGRNGVGDVVLFTLTMPSGEIDVYSLVEVARRYSECRPRYFGGDLIDAHHLHMLGGASCVVGRDGWVVRYLFRYIYNSKALLCAQVIRARGFVTEIKVRHLSVNVLAGDLLR